MFSRLGRAQLTLLVAAAGVALSSSPAEAFVDRDCGDFDSQRQAQLFFLDHGGPDSDPHGLDSDSDGIACETNPAPYYYGTTPPDSDPAPTVITSRVTLSLSRSSAIQGEPVRLSAAVSPQGSRTVVFQRRANGRWRVIERVTTGRLGRASHVLRAPRDDAKFRAIVAAKKSATKRFTADASDARVLKVLRQRVGLDLSRTSVDEDGDVTARAEAHPVRKGRAIELQVYRAGSWKTLGTRTQNSRGIARFGVPTGTVGTHRLRALVLRFHGAVPAKSGVDRLTVRDVTPPPVPTGLEATAGDATVALIWSATAASDFDHYVVFVRTTSSTWTWLGESTTPEWQANGLENGVTYEFAVASVDAADNASELSVAATATPVAPVVPRHGV